MTLISQPFLQRHLLTADTCSLEQVLEELDAAGEFFYEVRGRLSVCVSECASLPVSLCLTLSPTLSLSQNATGDLYYYTNETAAELHADFISPKLKTLAHLQGTSAQPVRDVSFVNLTWAYTAATFLEPYSAVMGGGDYANHVGSAALLAVGVDGLTVDNCVFADVGGTAVLLYSYIRRALITNSEFVRTGAHAILSVGTSNMVDGTGPDHPHGTVISGNLAHETGVFEKQNACFYMQVMTSSTVIQGNIAYNAPRALVNFNDEFGGGHLMTENLFFNAVRETADHGPFNSYNRLPQMTTTRDPQHKAASYFPAWTNLTRNFFIANYHSDDAMDHGAWRWLACMR